MKALIVDDEQHVRDAIRLLIDWNEFGIETLLEADNVAEAIACVEREQPEIVFTDMLMPGPSGIRLLEWLVERYPRTKTVVISGHDDFEFVRNTVKFGGIDYILKPIACDELRAAAAKAVDCRKREDLALQTSRERSIEVNQLKPVYWDKMFSNLAGDPTYYDTIQGSLQREFGLAADTRECRIAVLRLSALDRVIRDKFASSPDLLFFTLSNICNELLREAAAGYAFRFWNSDSEIVLLLWRRLGDAEALLARINDGLFAALQGRAAFGLGSVRPFPGGVAESLREAQRALKRRNLLVRGGSVFAYSAAEAPASSPALRLGEYEAGLRLAVRSGNEERIRHAVSGLFAAIRGLSSISEEQLELWQYEFALQRERWQQELFGGETERQPSPALAELAFEPPVAGDGTLSVAAWEERFAAGMIALARRVADFQHRESRIMFDIAAYIERHYDEEIALQDIAARFFLSREYISRKFKQDIGVNLSDYIERIRMDKAKLLLLNRSLRIAQIAATVGYKDEKYFSKVFKKLEGKTPGEYRREHEEGDAPAERQPGAPP
ncbi:MAG: response regulator [Paenibacillaceae bacterium]|nr:response regulator [Paenibacillaceae bacterium]